MTRLSTSTTKATSTTKEHPAGSNDAGRVPAIIGESRAIRELFAELDRLAHVDVRVLVTGESGVGKELVASAIHVSSARAGGPLVAVNCAGLQETLLESELFGHVKGSFTGAYRDKAGKFELAHTGTLFLDEVGDMTLRMQSLLLRVLETGEIQKVGADRPTSRVDCRIISATNRNLAELMQQGLFREDLYYRLSVIHVHVPPLRERKEDIPLLADHFLKRLIPEHQVAPRFSPDLYAALQSQSWPGNVRQLQNVVHRLVINRRAEVLTSLDLPAECRGNVPIPLPEPALERRRAVTDALYAAIRQGASFWDIVWGPYMEHHLTKADVRELVRRGLHECHGNYRALTKLFNVERSAYKRFMSFLRNHECLLPYRDYR